ncbi:MAG: deoxynucleoside kinase [Ruminococcus sp.]|nr:deoxynucleoside kinase [Ruminococcus sp.]
MSGKLIVVEGLDGSGKATQAERLYTQLKNQGKNVMKVSFPDYESDSSALVKMYLRGEFGDDPDAVNPYAASSFYAVDRFASYAKNWKSFYLSGGIVIADRYTTSNAIHQCSKLPEEEWEEFVKWLFVYEYQLLGIPEPYRTIYLRVDPEVSQRLMTKRYDSNESKKDIHERNVEYLMRSRRAADYCARTLGWSCVECVRDGEMRSIEEIAAEILCITEETE